MNYKIEGAIKKNKNAFIICLILWLILAIVFVAPVAYSSFQANASGVFSLNTFMEVLVDNITNPVLLFLMLILRYGVINRELQTERVV